MFIGDREEYIDYLFAEFRRQQPRYADGIVLCMSSHRGQISHPQYQKKYKVKYDDMPQEKLRALFAFRKFLREQGIRSTSDLDI